MDAQNESNGGNVTKDRKPYFIFDPSLWRLLHQIKDAAGDDREGFEMVGRAALAALDYGYAGIDAAGFDALEIDPTLKGKMFAMYDLAKDARNDAIANYNAEREQRRAAGRKNKGRGLGNQNARIRFDVKSFDALAKRAREAFAQALGVPVEKVNFTSEELQAMNPSILGLSNEQKFHLLERARDESENAQGAISDGGEINLRGTLEDLISDAISDGWKMF